MAKVRMNVKMRNDLTKFVDTFLPNLCKKEFKIKESKYKKAKDLVLRDRLKKYPDEDMAVLKKYNQTRNESTIVGVDPEGRQTSLSLKIEDQPQKPNNFCFTTIHPFKAATAKAIDEYELADHNYKETIKKRRADYDALINAYRYVEDVIEVWPASIKVLDDYLQASGRNLPVALPESALDRIKKSNLGS